MNVPAESQEEGTRTSLRGPPPDRAVRSDTRAEGGGLRMP
jgi:hypothetical protein